MRIITDTRESNPWTFSTVVPMPDIVYRGLKTGDYSIDGFEDRITVERKSLPDLFGSCGIYRDRFEAEFERMLSFEYAALVIEADLHTIIKAPPEYSAMNPKAVFHTLISWSMKYHVYIWACPNRIFAEKTCYYLFEFFMEHEKKGLHI